MTIQKSVIKSQLCAALCHMEMTTVETISGLAITHNDMLMITVFFTVVSVEL